MNRLIYKLPFIGRGPWPGLTNSWGEYRTWFTPIDNTNTFGRSNFSIHGGPSPGSAGCIDLTEDNNKFHQWFLKLKKSLVLNVQY